MNILEVSGYSFFAALAMLAGTLLVFFREAWVRKNSIFLISFAAGVMLTIAFTNLIPQANTLFPQAWLAVFGGFLGFYVLQNIVMFHPCHDEVCETHHLGVLSSIGLTVHSFLDGVIVAVGFEAGWTMGLFTTLAVMLHKIPDGITITGILLHAKMDRKKVILYSLGVALATPLGALAAYFFLQNISPAFLGMLLALTAGSFLYLAAADLLPETHKIRHRANAAYFFMGVGLIATLFLWLH